MLRRRGNGTEHARARRRAQEATVRSLVADAVTEAHAAQAAALHDPAGTGRTFVSEAALPAVCALNGMGAPALLPAMHQIVIAVQPGLKGPQGSPLRVLDGVAHVPPMGPAPVNGGHAAADGRRVGRVPPQQRPGPAARPEDTAPHGRSPVNEPGAGHVPRRSVRTGRGAPALTSAGRGLRSGRSQGILGRCRRDAHPPPPDEPGIGRHQADPPGTLSCARCFAESPPGVPPSHRPLTRPAARPTRPWPPLLSRTRGAHHKGHVHWQERPGNPLLLLVFTPRGSWGSPPSTSTGQRPCPVPPSQRPRRGTGCRPSCEYRRHRRYGGPPCAAPPGIIRLPPGAQGPEPHPGRELWRGEWATWLTRLLRQCRWMAAVP